MKAEHHKKNIKKKKEIGWASIPLLTINYVHKRFHFAQRELFLNSKPVRHKCFVFKKDSVKANKTKKKNDYYNIFDVRNDGFSFEDK